MKDTGSVDLATLGQALAADLREVESPDTYFGGVLGELAATFESALTGHSTVRYARNTPGGFGV